MYQNTKYILALFAHLSKYHREFSNEYLFLIYIFFAKKFASPLNKYFLSAYSLQFTITSKFHTVHVHKKVRNHKTGAILPVGIFGNSGSDAVSSCKGAGKTVH